MHQSPHKDFRRKRRNPTTFNHTTPTPTQHGCLLLDVPGEILSAITANLDPPALLALGESHISLSRHIGDDATWRTAFETNLGTGPLLRRVEPTWRKEYFNRHKTLLRFAYSRVPSTTYSSLPAPAISHIHLLSTNSGPTGLLSLSRTYGIVGRSIPFTGRVLPGFLDATGSTTGNGLGNPNAEFTPNVSACAIASAGNTVRILWGYRTGHIALMVTNRTLESPRRPAQEFRVSQEDEKHHGSVLDLMWINDHDLYAVSAGRDGKVKLWDYAHHNTPDLVWVSTTLPQSAVIPAPCIKVSGNRAQGMVVAVREDGSVDIWRGLDFQIMGSEEVRFSTTALPGPARAHPKVLALHIDPSSGDVLVAFHGEVCFYRVRAAQASPVTAYGAPEGGAILSSLQPYFSSNEGEESFILTGDKLGCVTAYEWKPEAPSDSTVRPARMFQASAPVDSRQEAITALHWTPAILATGTSGGVVVAWDSLTFEHLRVIVRPVGLSRTRRRRGLVQQQQQPAVGLDEEDPETPSPAVRQILAGDGGDTLIVNVGGEVIAWRAGDISTKTIAKSPLKGGKVASNSTSSPRGTTKIWNSGRVELAESSGRWSEQIEVKKIIADSQAQIRHEREEAGRLAKKKGAKAAQDKHLEKLGLSEGEALEYALVLSRESHPSPPQVSGPSTGIGPGRLDAGTSFVAEIRPGDALTDEQLQAVIEGGFFSSNAPAPDVDAKVGETVTPSPSVGPTTNSISNIRTGDALADGGVLASASASALSTPTRLPVADLDLDFPAILSRSPSSVGSLSQSPVIRHRTLASEDDSPSPSPPHFASLLPGARIRRRESIGSAISSWSSMSGGSESARQNAWSRPLNTTSFAVASPSTPSSNSVRSVDASRGDATGSGLDDMDEDLRYALELSLAEARSRDV